MKHGGDLTDAIAKYGGAPEDWLDLSTGINPQPWPIPADIPRTAWSRLPGRSDQLDLIAAARSAYRLDAGVGVVSAPGTQALIQWVARLAPAGGVAVVSPTYGEHEAAWRQAGRNVTGVRSLASLPQSMRHAVLVRPDNPDGSMVPEGEVVAAAREIATRDGWLVVDEAFIDVCPSFSVARHVADLPIVVLRSFGKFYGLAGLRLGFAIAAPAIADSIATALGPWAVSGPALEVGRRALLDEVWAEATRVRLAHDAKVLDAVLGAAGLAVVGGTDLYRLVRHGRASAIHDQLGKAHIWTRRFDWAPDLIRFGLAGTSAGRARLTAALATSV